MIIPMNNRITELFKIKYPIIQAGMIWCSGWELASAVSNAGGLGIIGSGSMYPEILREHIKKCKASTPNPFAVNVPLLYPDIEKHIAICIEEGVKIVFTSAGNPKTWTKHLHDHGIIVVHLIASSKFAKKAEDAGCDAIVAEGFEAGGHNGREETTTLVLIPQVREESSAHVNFKNIVAQSNEGDTMLSMKKVVPVRLIKNDFQKRIQEAEDRGATTEELATILGRARAKKGMFEGDMAEGELEIGQIASFVKEIKPAGEIVKEVWEEFLEAKKQIQNL